MNPIEGFVVEPKICIASPKFVRDIDKKKQIATKPKVALKLSCLENFLFIGINSYSRVSLQGSIVKGVAKNMTNYIPNNEIMLVSVSPGYRSKMFFRDIKSSTLVFNANETYPKIPANK
jgi:hypothetical protein